MNIEQEIQKIINESEKNRFDKFQIFDNAILGYGNPDDELYKSFKATPEANLPDLILPKEWLPECQTVVSVFLPFSKTIRMSNRGGDKCSVEWSIGRIEGQEFIQYLLQTIVDKLNNEGIKTVAPLLDPRFKAVTGEGTNPLMPDRKFTSTWSERHNGFICGLGTFGLSKGLITKKGIAGRFMSFLIDIKLPYTKRDYKGLYDYCIMCGECVKNCPAHAIDLDGGKKHEPCYKMVSGSKLYLNGRIGCGKCQTNVPCESGIPIK